MQFRPFAALLVLFSAAPLAAHASCLDDFSGPIESIAPTNDYVSLDFHGLDDEARVDGRAAILRHLAAQNKYPVDVRTGNNQSSACASGVTIDGEDDLLLTWSGRYRFGNHGAVIGRGGHLTFENLRLFNTWDGIRPERGTEDQRSFLVDRAWLTNNRDDCVENDNNWSGTVRDSLFDGCYIFMSATGTGSDGTGQVVTIEDSIIRMARMPGPHGHKKKDSKGVPLVAGHGRLFKWDSSSPRIALKNVIIYWEWMATTKYGESNWESHAFNQMGFRISQGQLESCENVTIIWPREAEERWGPFPGDIDRSCVTVTSDVSLYENARANWIKAHPDLMRLPGDPFTVELDKNRVPQLVPISISGGSSNDDPDPAPVPEPDPGDSTAPEVAIQSPVQNGTVIVGSTVDVVTVASDNDDLKQVELYVDDKLHNTFLGNPPFKYAWRVDGNSGSSRRLKAVASDQTGNTKSHTVTVTTMAEPDPGSDLKLSFVKVSQITENSALVSFSFHELTTGETRWGTSPDNLDRLHGPETDLYDPHNQRLRGLPPGTTIYYQVNGCNPAGRCGTSAVSSFKTLGTGPGDTGDSGDSTPPEVAIKSPTQGGEVTIGSTVDVVTVASDNDGLKHVELYVDDTLHHTFVGDAPFTYAWRVDGNSGSSRRLKAVAMDQSGNTSSHTVTVTTMAEPDPAPEPSTFNLLVSSAPDRSNSSALQGSRQSGKMYVHLNPPVKSIKLVWFWVDDPAMLTRRDNRERKPPYDLAGTNGDLTARPYDTRRLANGKHTITAKVFFKDGSTEALTRTFTVKN